MRLPARRALYAIGAVAGLAAALIAALGAPRFDAIGLGAAAVVNGEAIPREALDRAIEALESDKRNPVTAADRADALEKLIDEELLVQRGVELGLAESDLSVRKALVQSTLQLALSEIGAGEPGDDELRRFYAENAGLFTAPARTVLSLVPSQSGSADKLPSGPLTDADIVRYLGPTLARAVATLEVGELSQPFERGGRVQQVRVDWRSPAATPTFEQIKPQILAEWERRRDETAIRAYLERLKRRARLSRTAAP